VDVLQRCFTGLETTGNTLRINPAWPGQLGTLTFAVRYREQHLMVRINSASMRVSAEPGKAPPIRVQCWGQRSSSNGSAAVGQSSSRTANTSTQPGAAEDLLRCRCGQLRRRQLHNRPARVLDQLVRQVQVRRIRRGTYLGPDSEQVDRRIRGDEVLDAVLVQPATHHDAGSRQAGRL
jgi:hypothetical protein